MPLRDTFGAVRAAADARSFKEALRLHKQLCESQGVRGTHLEMCMWYCLHSQIDVAEDTLVVAVSSPWNLLAVGRQINSEWPLVLHADATFNICRCYVALITLGLNILGGHYRYLVATIVCPGVETKTTYSVSYNAMRSAFAERATNPKLAERATKCVSTLHPCKAGTSN